MQAMVQPPPSVDRQELVVAIQSLYALTGDVDHIIRAWYHPSSASFQDPLVHVHGAKDVMGQFRALQAAFRLAGDKAVEVRSVTHGERVVLIDWQITYIVRLAPSFLDQFFAVTLPNITRLDLDEAGRVLTHTDHWSVHELVGSVPVLGLLYRGAKRVTGKLSSVLTNFVWDVCAGPDQQLQAPTSPSSTVMGSLGSATPPSEASLAFHSSSASSFSAPAARSARGVSSGTITSVASGGARSSIGSGSGGMPESMSEEDKVLLAGPGD